MSIKPILISLTRGAAFAAVLGAMATLPLAAQNAMGAAPMLTSAAPATTALDMILGGGNSSALSAETPRYEGTMSSSSSSSSSADEFSLKNDASQPPPRRYGRPNYHDNNTNADGSSKYSFDVGAGLTIPTGNANKYLHTSYGIQLGGGRNFNKTLGLMLQFEFDNFGFDSSTLAAQGTTYGVTDLGGTSHVWSFTLNPVINFLTSDSGGAYFLFGGGFYHKTANFTVPATGEYCDYYGFCYSYVANATIDKYTSNAAGAQAGLGFTWRLSRFSNERLFVEGKYEFMDNQPRAASTTNFYPPNSNRTQYIPITVGIRW